MNVGALFGPIRNGASSRVLAEQAREFEAEGFHSVWTVQAIGRGFMMTDPLIALAAASAVTERVILGTAVLQAPLYNTIELAHRVFSLHQMCGDRLVLGIGAGSTESDFAAVGRSYDNRFATFNQQLVDLRNLFSTGGLGGTDLTPWSDVAGGPKMFLGSWGKGVARAANEFDGWISSASYRSDQEICAAHARYREAGGQYAVVSTIQVNNHSDLGELKDRVQRFEETGIDEVVFMIVGDLTPGLLYRALQ